MITLDQVLSGRNILRATKQVVSNKGAPGIDGMTVDQYEAHHRRHWRSIAEHIRAGSYIPAPVRRVDIPKPNGGTRMLGIPTVQDRVIQQAIAQILVEAYDPTSRTQVTGSALAEAPSKRSNRPLGTSRRERTGWWRWTWKSSSTP